MCLRLYLSILGIGVALGAAPSAIAQNPDPLTESVRARGNEVIDFGSFRCTTAKADDQKVVWTCPKQSFPSKFKEPPVVFFSIAAFDRLTTSDGAISLSIDTTDDITKDGFQPVVAEPTEKRSGFDKSTIRVNWIAIGDGERPERTRPTAEERKKLREQRRQERQKSQ